MEETVWYIVCWFREYTLSWGALQGIATHLGAVTESLKGLSNIPLSKVLQDSGEHGKLN